MRLSDQSFENSQPPLSDLEQSALTGTTWRYSYHPERTQGPARRHGALCSTSERRAAPLARRPAGVEGDAISLGQQPTERTMVRAARPPSSCATMAASDAAHHVCRVRTGLLTRPTAAAAAPFCARRESAPAAPGAQLSWHSSRQQLRKLRLLCSRRGVAGAGPGRAIGSV